jgi:hypothetical protein
MSIRMGASVSQLLQVMAVPRGARTVLTVSIIVSNRFNQSETVRMIAEMKSPWLDLSPYAR